MLIAHIRHKGLRRLIEDDDVSGLPAAVIEKLRAQITFLQTMENADELLPIIWKAHQMTGDRRGTWTFYVTKNWRLTWIIEGDPPEIRDLDYEDYH